MWRFVVSGLLIVVSCAVFSIGHAQDPPRIIVKPEDSVVEVGKRISFFCRADGNPMPTITWKRNDETVADYSRYVALSAHTGVASLRIEPVNYRDNGTKILCVADNGLGTPAMAEATLIVLNSDELPLGFPKVLRDPRQQSVELGRPAAIICDFTGDPPPSIHWLRDHMPVDTAADPRYKISTLGKPDDTFRDIPLTVASCMCPARTGSLLISNSSSKDEGVFECIIRNKFGVSHSKGASLYVKVRRVPPHFSIPPDPTVEVSPGGSVNITCVAVGWPMPRVFWREGFQNMNGQDENNGPSGRNVLELVNVRQSKNYTCVAVSSLGNIEAVTQLLVKALPQPPTGVTIGNVTAHSVALSWSPSRREDDVKQYVVQYRPKKPDMQADGFTDAGDYLESTPVATTSILLTGLEPFQQYEFRVMAVNNVGRGMPSLFTDITTGEARPETAPVNVQARPISDRTVVVQWDVPSKPNGQILEYIVYYHTDVTTPYEHRPTVTVSKARLTHLDNLQPDVMYYIAVQARNKVGLSPLSETVNVITKQGVPGQPYNLRASPVGSDGMLLRWEAPLLSAQQVIGYRVQYNSSLERGPIDVDVVPPATLTTLTALQPATNYSFRVIARSSRGEGAPSAFVFQATNPTVPAVSPEGVSAEALSPTSIRLRWDPPAKISRAGLIDSYRIRWEPVSSQDAELGQMEQAASKPRLVDVVDLQKWTEYRFYVAAGKHRSFGPDSVAVIARTAEDATVIVEGIPDKVPSAPRHVDPTLLNATAVEVVWREPATPNGPLAGYNVYYQMTKDDEIVEGEREVQIRVDKDKLRTVITGLRPGKEYAIRVNAFNRRGDGEFSKSEKVAMPGEVPGAPQNVRFEQRVAGPKSASFLVQWSAPILSDALPVTKYHVSYAPLPLDDGAPKTKPTNVDVQGTSAIIDGLGYGRSYEFYISARNDEGPGPAAREVLRTPERAPTAPPSNVYAVFTNGGLRITWEAPPLEQRNGLITHYVVNVSSMTATANVPADPSENGGYFNVAVQSDDEITFKVAAATVGGVGPFSESARASQDRALPAPRNVYADALSNTSLVIYWLPVQPENGLVARYRVLFSRVSVTRRHRRAGPRWEERVVQADACNLFSSASKLPSKPQERLPPNVCHVVLDGLSHHADYLYKVGTVGRSGESGPFSEARQIQVKPKYVVKDLRVRFVNSSAVALQWAYDGTAMFDVFFTGWKQYLQPIGTLDEFRIPPETVAVNYTGREIVAATLWAHTNYTFYVAANDGARHWPVAINVTTHVKEPPRVEAPRPLQSLNSFSYEFSFQPTTHEFGPISEYWLVVVPTTWPKLYTGGHLLQPLNIPNEDLLRGNDREMPPQNEPWIAASFTRQKLLTYSGSPTPYVLGENNADGSPFRNWPLEKGKNYRAFLRVFVGVGASRQISASSEWTDEFHVWSGKSEPREVAQGNLWMLGPIIAVVVVLLILIFGVLLIAFLKRRRKRNSPMKQASINKVTMIDDSMEASKLLLPEMYQNLTALPPYTDTPPTYDRLDAGFELKAIGGGQFAPTAGMAAHPPVPITELALHIERLKANDNLLFSQEYDSIDPGQHFTWENSNLEWNKPKNRYANVIAYDHSRVVLNSLDGMAGSDYINANYCDGYRKPKAYVATQGPLPETFGDFWRMVYEENSCTIVMLTKLEERTRVKCDQYWPSRGSAVYGVVSVTLKDCLELAHYTIRTFHIQRAGTSELREVKHLQFTAWPDHGVPQHATPFLMFLKRVRSVNPADVGPIVVHCSAGVGRSGAYVVIDYMLDRLRYESTVDMYGQVTCLRAQRNYMVQTEDQYIFIHDAVLDAVQSGSTEVPVSKLYTHLQKLMQTPVDGATGMELEFRHLANLRMQYATFNAANLPCNKPKNRLVTILANDSTRVCLSPVRGVEGSDYINASFIDGYRQRAAYIATQGPLPATVDDFWRMLWEHNSTLVVMLTKLRELGREKCHQYWPSDRAQQYGVLSVDPIAEYNMPQYILREFKLTDTRDGQSRTIRHFQYTEWPEQGVPKSAEFFIDFIGQVHKTKEQFGQDGPITVHCSAGVGRTAAFIALGIILERMRFESVIDVFTTVKLLRAQRPSMIQSEDQYHFLYQASLEYLGSFDHYAMQ